MENFFIDIFGNKENICYYYNIRNNDLYNEVIKLLSEVKNFYSLINMDLGLFDYKIDFLNNSPYINFSILMDSIFPFNEINENHKFINDFIMFVIKNKVKVIGNNFYFSYGDINNYIEYLSNNRLVFTYIMKDKFSGLYKIGRSKKPVFREKTLLAQLPSIILEFLLPFNIENRLHIELKSKRIRGEWFNLNNNELKSLINRYKFYKNCNLFITNK